jgi:two-component system chemotaxis sensor kinase CheA
MDEAGRQKRKDLLINTVERVIQRMGGDGDRKVELETSRFTSRHIPRHYRKLVKDICVQMTRNSINHGIEPREERKSAGKPEHGTIMLASMSNGETLDIIFRDDGRGVNFQRIRESARKNSSITEKMDVDTLTAEDLVSLIFHPGFTTREKATTAAGRGIGMDLIKSQVETRGGKLHVRTKPGHYMEFRIKLPLTAA